MANSPLKRSSTTSVTHDQQRNVKLEDLTPTKNHNEEAYSQVKPVKKPLVPYKVTITSQDVVRSSHYRMTGRHNNQIDAGDLDIKNKVLKDKRRALIRVLKDKRPTHQTGQQNNSARLILKPSFYNSNNNNSSM